MKRTIFLTLLILAIFLACDPNPNPTPEPEPTETPAATPEPIQPPEPVGNVQFALYDGTTLKLWDGVRLVNAYTGTVNVAGHRKIAIDDVLYYFDGYGRSEFSRWLPDTPDAIVTKPAPGTKADTVYSDDIYTLVDIPPAEAYALGALPHHYTKVFENGLEVGQWNLNDWQVDRVISTASGHILAQDVLGAWHNLTDSKVIYNAYQDGIMIYNVNELGYTGFISDETGDYPISWSNGFFHHSRWQKAGDVWYTENGFTWSNTQGLRTTTNALYNWNEYANYPATYDAPYGEKPYLLPSGVHYENGEDVLYYVECNTGQMYRFIPSTNNLSLFVEVYDGSGYRMDGIPYFNTLKPEIIGKDFMYHADAMIRKVDLVTGLVSVFGPEEELIKW